MKYYISDPHFFHKRIIQYENRPFATIEEMNAALIRNWNNRVKDNDEVYVLGDFAFTNGEGANALLDQLNGKKYLIRGNHDKFLDKPNFDKTKFEWIKDYAMIRDGDRRGRMYKVVLFHYPIVSWDSMYHGSIQLYGHVHSHEVKRDTLTTNRYNVSADVLNFTPKTLAELIEKYGYATPEDIENHLAYAKLVREKISAIDLLTGKLKESTND